MSDFYTWRDVSPRLERFFLWQEQKTLREVGQIFERIKVQSDYIESPRILDDVRNVLRMSGFSYEAARSFFRDVAEENLPLAEKILRKAYFGNMRGEHDQIPIFDLGDVEEPEEALLY